MIMSFYYCRAYYFPIFEDIFNDFLPIYEFFNFIQKFPYKNN